VSVFSWTALPSGANRPLTCIPFQLPCSSFAVFNKVFILSCVLNIAPLLLSFGYQGTYMQHNIFCWSPPPPSPLPTLAWVYKGRACELCLLWHVLQRPVWR
jgi:hypothetical protein